ncbi:MAG: TlpA disulfide reductase family protein [Chloroflexi bacterium]|nr:TlpA disulfide reductase family protein [Chloroflexota bacterium]
MNRIARYATVAAIVLLVGGIFVWRDVLPRYTGAQQGILDASAKVEVGAPAPDFLLTDAKTGQPVKLSDYRGKAVLLNFWATWCGPCRAEMPEFQKVYAARGEELAILAVDYRESPEQILFFNEEFNLTFPLLVDRPGAVQAHYGVQGLPSTFFIDKDGILQRKSVGPALGSVLTDGLRAAGLSDPERR